MTATSSGWRRQAQWTPAVFVFVFVVPWLLLTSSSAGAQTDGDAPIARGPLVEIGVGAGTVDAWQAWFSGRGMWEFWNHLDVGLHVVGLPGGHSENRGFGFYAEARGHIGGVLQLGLFAGLGLGKLSRNDDALPALSYNGSLGPTYEGGIGARYRVSEFRFGLDAMLTAFTGTQSAPLSGTSSRSTRLGGAILLMAGYDPLP